MKQFTILLIFAFSFGCTTKNDSYFLNGAWTPVKQEMGGTIFPDSAFKDYTLTLKDSIYTYQSTEKDQGTLKYENGKMDIYGNEGANAGKHYPAIYKIENDQLVICYNLSGNNYPETFDTKDKPMYFISVYKKR